MPNKRPTALNTNLGYPTPTPGLESPYSPLKSRKTACLRPASPPVSTLPVAILAGGFGTRLYPLTGKIPKSMVPVNGKPFIAHQLRLLESHGVERVILCVGHLGEQIQEYVGNGYDFGLTVEYSWDGPGPTGTGAALRKALPKLGDAFLVLYGDSYLPCSYRAVQNAFLQSGRLVQMTVFYNNERWGASNVQFEGGQIITHSKQYQNPFMRHLDYGLGAFQKSAFDVLSEKLLDLSDIYQHLLAQGQLAAFEVRERFYEVGSFEGILALSEFLND